MPSEVHDVVTHANFCQDWSNGFWRGEGSNFGLFHWLASSPLKHSHYRASVWWQRRRGSPQTTIHNRTNCFSVVQNWKKIPRQHFRCDRLICHSVELHKPASCNSVFFGWLSARSALQLSRFRYSVKTLCAQPSALENLTTMRYKDCLFTYSITCLL